MTKVDFTIAEDDLKALFVRTRFSYGKDMKLDRWKKECKKAYRSYLEEGTNRKTYSEWVNGQLIAL